MKRSYKNSTGNPNTPAGYKTPDGYLLGIWQGRQRREFKKNILSPDRVKRLQEIGFIWDMRKEQFEKGFQETLHYKKSTGNPNTPADYKTPDGYRLGIWQSNQRSDYKDGKLSPERIKRLEEIGFRWDFRKHQ